MSMSTECAKMDTAAILKHLIVEEGSFPALKLLWNKQFDMEELEETPKLTPSQYLNENSMSTEERHKALSKQQRKMRYHWPEVEVKVEPPMIVFQSYKLGETLKFPIAVRNVSKKSQKVVLLMDESYVFKFDECSERVGKFPCGMCITATITFTPDSAAEDYFHQLIVSTNMTKVVVPIIALGARPLLTAPDTLFLSDSPVKHWATKPVTFLNTGKKTARFTLDSNGPFCVKPDKGVAPPNHAFTFDVAYFSKYIASHEGEIRIRFDNDEEVFIDLKANAINYDIKLSSPDIRCEDTFISLQTRSVIHIVNNSNINARFLWKKLVSPSQRPRKNVESPLKSECNESVKSTETKGEVDVEQIDGKEVCLGDISPLQDDNGNEVVNERKIDDDMFYNENFHVYPLLGEVKANSRTEIHIVFSPKECKFYEGTAYLDITGQETRIPFQLYGRGIGPKFKLGFEILNVGEVALGGSHTYEVPVQNTSEIPGVVQCDGLVGPSSGLGMKIEPPFLVVGPCQYSAFYVNITSTGTVGTFQDEVKFSVRETGDAFYITVTGKLTYPSITFANTEFIVGNLSYGFPKTFSIPIVNESLNYVQVDLKMGEDGDDPPIDFNTILETFKISHSKLPGNPAEFKVEPRKFTLVPRGMQNIQLTMFPNQIREIRSSVKCFITDTNGRDVETVASISIRGSVVVPSIEITKEMIYVKDCYIQYPTPAELILSNSSELPVIYHIVQQKPTHNVKVTSASFIGVADPWVETKIPFEVTAIHAGESVAHLDLFAAGVEEKLQSVSLTCASISSKVEANLKNIDFGKIDILDEKSSTVDVTNMSPLTFAFTAVVFQDEPSDRGETWKVEPESGVLHSEDKLTFTVRVTLREVGFHNAGIRITMTEPQNHVIEVKVKAQGVGTALLFDPPLQKLLDFGTVFIKQEVSFEYKVTNLGVNPQALEWKALGEKAPQNKMEGKGPFRKAEHKPSNISTKGAKRNKQPAFVLSPPKLIVAPGATANLSISAFSTTNKTVDDAWNLWTFVPITKVAQFDERLESPSLTSVKKKLSISTSTRNSGQSKDEKKKKQAPVEPTNLHLKPSILQDIKIHAVFEAPGLKFSKRSLNFLIDATPAQQDFASDEIVNVANVGTLPLRVNFKTKYPFAIGIHGGEPQEEVTHFFDTETVIGLKIHFDGRHLRKEVGMVTFNGKLDASYEGLHGTDSIELHGVVSFPQLHLDRTEIDFGRITNGMEAVEQVTVTNPGNFCLTYKWYIKPGSTEVQKNPRPSWTKDMSFDKYRPSINNPLMFLNHRAPRARSTSSSSQKEGYSGPNRDKFLEVLGIKSSIYATEDASNYEGFTGFIREKMYRSRMMEFMGLRDAEYEAEDEVNYLAYYNQNLLTSFNQEEEFNTNELIDVIPLAGLIQAGQSQTFTFVFYGYPDINFKASLILYVEGGARKTVEVKGSTVPPKSKSLSIVSEKEGSTKSNKSTNTTPKRPVGSMVSASVKSKRK